MSRGRQDHLNSLGVNSAGPKYTISVAKCSTYDRQAVDAAVHLCVDRLGGVGKFVSKGETILLKPNMLSPRSPDMAVTTHPEIVRAAIKLVKEAGGTPIVGDTPGGRATESVLTNLAQKTGIRSMCDEEGVEFVLLIESEKVRFPQGVAAKSFEIATWHSRVDGMISLAKFKTHSFTVLTGAVKNLFGLIPGLKKVDYHLRMQSADAFSELLVDLAECVRPRLTIMDGIVGMDGDGPAAGRPKEIGIVMASTNVHALDAFMTELVGADPDSVPTVAIARRRGLVSKDRHDLQVVGGDRTSLAIADFKMPAAPAPSRRIPRAFVWMFGELFSRKPVFSKKNCTLCGQCIEVCSAGALSKGADRPRIDRSLCFRCYCCSEVCADNAVRLRRVPGRSIYGNVSARAKRQLRKD
jgi:uncharacterized protein (DUF362 family)/Pyruvate/2-oxoacid:ferredoxin oxidoreductase delta subunit